MKFVFCLLCALILCGCGPTRLQRRTAPSINCDPFLIQTTDSSIKGSTESWKAKCGNNGTVFYCTDQGHGVSCNSNY